MSLSRIGEFKKKLRSILTIEILRSTYGWSDAPPVGGGHLITRVTRVRRDSLVSTPLAGAGRASAPRNLYRGMRTSASKQPMYAAASWRLLSPLGVLYYARDTAALTDLGVMINRI